MRLFASDGPESRFLWSQFSRQVKPAPETGVLCVTCYDRVRLRVMTLMYSPVRPVGRGSLQASRSQ